MDGKDIIKTLIELIEAQEHVKITYTIREKEEIDECNTISTPEQSVARDS